ncbi:MAG: hypothetical protein ACJAZO_002957 [Myxococcota bacterium]|jgi:hypothetical protein
MARELAVALSNRLPIWCQVVPDLTSEHFMPLSKRRLAKLIRTFWPFLEPAEVLCPRQAFAFTVSILWVSLAFGLTVLTLAFATGHISSCNLHPAVSLGWVAGGRCDAWDLGPYVLIEVLGGIRQPDIYVITSGNTDFLRGPVGSYPTAMARSPQATTPSSRVSSLRSC